MTRAVATLTLLVALAARCGSSQPSVPKIGAARTFHLGGFEPSGAFTPKRETAVTFRIVEPSGRTLTRYRRGSGPHTGVHVIVVPDDLSALIHEHPPISADGTVRTELELPKPGKYRVVVDAYPTIASLPNFQLHRNLTARGAATATRLPPFRKAVTAGGVRVVLPVRPRLTALEASFLEVSVTDARGRPARFTPWFGALAHAIFFRRGSLDYFHTHVCGPGAPQCTSTLGGPRIVGRATPGKLRIGVLLPSSGTWRMFIQAKVDGHVVTAPFTLDVR